MDLQRKKSISDVEVVVKIQAVQTNQQTDGSSLWDDLEAYRAESYSEENFSLSLLLREIGTMNIFKSFENFETMDML